MRAGWFCAPPWRPLTELSVGSTRICHVTFSTTDNLRPSASVTFSTSDPELFLLPLFSARQVDDLVGAVVATLETERLIDSTYIFYSSDQCAPLSSLCLHEHGCARAHAGFGCWLTLLAAVEPSGFHLGHLRLGFGKSHFCKHQPTRALPLSGSWCRWAFQRQ